MARLTRSERIRIANAISRLHDATVGVPAAQKLIHDAEPLYLHSRLRAAVKAGLGAHLQTTWTTMWDRVSVRLYTGTDIEALRADSALRAAVKRLVPPTTNHRYEAMSQIRGWVERFATTTRLLEVHPELAPIVASVMRGAPTPEPKALRRKLLRAGWPLRAKKNA